MHAHATHNYHFYSKKRSPTGRVRIDHEKTFCTRALSEEQLPESRRMWHRLAQGAPVLGRSGQASVRRHGT